MTNPYNNISDQCFHCVFMSLSGCACPYENLQVQDKGVEQCPFFGDSGKE